MMMIFRKLLFRSVGNMGGETRAGPGSLKLKTGFSDITSKQMFILTEIHTHDLVYLQM